MNRIRTLLLAAALALSACHRRRHPPSPAASPRTDAGSIGLVTRSQSGASVYTRSTCPADCCGGSACSVSAANVGENGCKQEAGSCGACLSGITCIPGECGALLGSSEAWTLHLSAVLDYDAAGNTLDPCKPLRNVWLCLSALTKPVCIAQSDACAHDGKSVAGVSVTTDDLVSHGVAFEVREGSAQGRVIARRVGARYAGGLQRRGLCRGFRMDFDKGPVAGFTYFLLPASVQPAE